MLTHLGDRRANLCLLKPKNPETLESRVIRAAEAALSHQQYVSAIDVLCGMGLLAPVNVEAWRKGRIDFLEEVIQGSPGKISTSLAFFRHWADKKGLKPSETHYVRSTRRGTVDMQFSRSRDPDIEKNYRTQYISPDVSERKQQRLQEKLNSAPQPVVFQILRESHCSECGIELVPDSLLTMEGEQALCMSCAQLADLEFLASGDAALTRRATKYSARRAVVVRFSRARNRYERQGVLVEPAALERAEQEGNDDAPQRTATRARDAIRRRSSGDSSQPHRLR